MAKKNKAAPAAWGRWRTSLYPYLRPTARTINQMLDRTSSGRSSQWSITIWRSGFAPS